jgi:hypothetical protein
VYYLTTMSITKVMQRRRSIYCINILSYILRVRACCKIPVGTFAKKDKHSSQNFMFIVPCIVDLYYNKPTRCRSSQSILLYCRVTLHVSGAFHTHHQEYTRLYLQPPVQVILSLQLPSSNVADFELKLDHVGRR